MGVRWGTVAGGLEVPVAPFGLEEGGWYVFWVGVLAAEAPDEDEG